MIQKKRVRISLEEAKQILQKGEAVHVFIPAGPCLVGADWDRKVLMKMMEAHPEGLMLTGKNMRAMRHGLALLIEREDIVYFIATDEDAVQRVEQLPELEKVNQYDED